MKKLISMFLAIALCLSFAACSPSLPYGDETTATPDDKGETTATPDDKGETTATPDDKGETTATPDDKGETTATPDDKGETTATPDDKDDTDHSENTTIVSDDGDAVGEIPDGFFIENGNDYVSDSIVQSGNDTSSNDDNSVQSLKRTFSLATFTYARIFLPRSEFCPTIEQTTNDITASTDATESTDFMETTESLDSTDADSTEADSTVKTDESTEAISEFEESSSSPNEDIDTSIKGYDYNLKDCCVSGYIGNGLYIIQDYGSLGWNKKGVGHSDGTYVWGFGENEGFFSISSMNENMIVVGNPTDESIDSLWGDTSSYLFGYLVYDENSKTLKPLYETDNLRFYTATYFIDGCALVSVEIEGELLFGVINTKGEYVIDPGYQMMHDEVNNGIAIAAKEITVLANEYDWFGKLGRFIEYSNTLFTNVQSIRRFEYSSSTVGLVDVSTGEEILPCQYSYVEYLGKTEYFVIDSEGKTYLFNSSDRKLVGCQMNYSYFANGWTLIRTAEGTYHLKDAQGRIYSTEGLHCVIDEIYDKNTLADYFSNQDSLTMTNILSSEREEQSLKYRTAPIESFHGAIEGDGLSYKIWNKAHDQFIEVDSVAAEYGKILFTKDNYVYRLDYDTFEYTRLEIGFGGFSELSCFEGFENVEFKTTVSVMGDGIYNVRVSQDFEYGSSYHEIVINEYGDVILDIAINSTYSFNKNYLGLYDEALYEIAGNTDMKDNYFIIRDDGRICVLQFVREQISEKDDFPDENAIIQYPDRTISKDGSSIYTSPFIFNLDDPSSVEITFEGNVVEAQNYYYDPSAQALKFNPHYLDSILYDESMLESMSFSFCVTAGEQTVTVSFIIKTYTYS